MIKRLFDWLKQPLGLIAVGIAFLALFSFAAYGISLTQQSPAQPIQFPHKTHAGFGIQCLYCHPGAAKGPSAGIPTEAKCWGCRISCDRQYMNSSHTSINSWTSLHCARRDIQLSRGAHVHELADRLTVRLQRVGRLNPFEHHLLVDCNHWEQRREVQRAQLLEASQKASRRKRRKRVRPRRK